MNSVNNSQQAPRSGPENPKIHSSAPHAAVWIRSLALFTNFFLIILAYYQVKAASRALLLEYGGSGLFPYVWIISAFTLLILIGIYHRLVSKLPRIGVVLGALLIFTALLCLFRYLTPNFNTTSALAFYVFVDIFSVVLVEQFWSLTNSISTPQEGRKTFWFVSTGGLCGGLAGGLLAGALVENGYLATADLLYVCAGILVLVFILNFLMWARGMYTEATENENLIDASDGWRALMSNPYLMLIAALLCLSQLAQPVVEYQFLNAVESTYSTLEERTVYFGQFFAFLNIASIGVNLLVTPLIHRHLGIFAGLAVQPLMLAFGAFGFFLYPSLSIAAGMKIADRGLSYSINRASKEQLYIPVDPKSTYQAKAWIDMLGYRLFKVLGSGLILLATGWLPITLSVPELSILTFAICLIWLYVIALVSRQYYREVAVA
ncbi:MAG: NTP/NDP exchange transporter [Gammaproteobacteria bacterium]